MYPQPGQSYTYGIRPKQKKHFPRWAGLALLLAVAGLFISTPTRSQLQQSGGPGSSVTISAALPAGANVIGQVSINQATPGTTNLVSIGTNGTVAINAALPAGANSIGTVVNGPGTASIGKVTDNTSCSTTVLDPPWAAIPTSPTAVTATTTCVEAILFTNTNATPQTVTVTDGQATAITVINAFSIPGNSQVTFPFYGTPLTTGIKWSAGGTGVNGSVHGFQ